MKQRAEEYRRFVMIATMSPLPCACSAGVGEIWYAHENVYRASYLRMSGECKCSCASCRRMHDRAAAQASSQTP